MQYAVIKKTAIAGLISLLCAGCATVGPKAVKQGHQPYNEAMISSWKEQLLLNLVRLRYNDNPYFIEVSTINAKYEFVGKFGFMPHWQMHGPKSANFLEFKDSHLTYTESPTITYMPLTGDKFVRQMMSPIAAEHILAMTTSGWDGKRVLGLCLERINDYNASETSGSAPEVAPDLEQFYRVIELLGKLDAAGLIEVGLNPSDKENDILVRIHKDKNYAADIKELYGLLEVSEEHGTLSLDGGFLAERTGNTVHIKTRSLMGVLSYLSLGVQVPEDHVKEDQAIMTKNADGSNYDWNIAQHGHQISIKSSVTTPKNAAVAVCHHGYWYYIENKDHSSKSTFMLLSTLFQLQAGQAKYTAPTLTLAI